MSTTTSMHGSKPGQVPPSLIGRDPRESIPRYHCGDGPRACGRSDQPARGGRHVNLPPHILQDLPQFRLERATMTLSTLPEAAR